MPTPVENWREGARTGHTHEPNDVTVQLDGLGRQLSELTAEPGVPEGSDGPVFVDESGRLQQDVQASGLGPCRGLRLLRGDAGRRSARRQFQRAVAAALRSETAQEGGRGAGCCPFRRAAPTRSCRWARHRAPRRRSRWSAAVRRRRPEPHPAARPRPARTRRSRQPSYRRRPAPPPAGARSRNRAPRPRPPAATTTPPVDPGPTGTPTSPVESPDPPVQEQEGAQ